jgi:hypothetical protein
VDLYIHSPNNPLWRGAQLMHRDKFAFTLSGMKISMDGVDMQSCYVELVLNSIVESIPSQHLQVYGCIL